MSRSVLVGGLMLMSGMSLTLGTEKSPRNTKVTVSFRNGVDGYSGTIGSEIWALAPTTILDGNGNASTDADNDGGESQVLLRFDGIIGSESRQVPPNAVVHSAKLLVSAFDQGRSAGSNTLMSVIEDGTFREWDMHEGKQLRTESENIGGLLAVGSAAARPFVVGEQPTMLYATGFIPVVYRLLHDRQVLPNAALCRLSGVWKLTPKYSAKRRPRRLHAGGTRV